MRNATGQYTTEMPIADSSFIVYFTFPNIVDGRVTSHHNSLKVVSSDDDKELELHFTIFVLSEVSGRMALKTKRFACLMIELCLQAFGNFYLAAYGGGPFKEWDLRPELKGFNNSLSLFLQVTTDINEKALMQSLLATLLLPWETNLCWLLGNFSVQGIDALSEIANIETMNWFKRHPKCVVNNSVGAYVNDRERVVKYMVDWGSGSLLWDTVSRIKLQSGHCARRDKKKRNSRWIMFCDILKRCGLGIIHDSFGFGSLLLKDYCDGESKLNDSSCVFVEPKNDAEIDGVYGNCGIKLGGKWSLLIRHILWNFNSTFSREADTFGAEVLKDTRKNRLAFDDNKSWFVDVIMQILVDDEGCIILCVTALVFMGMKDNLRSWTAFCCSRLNFSRTRVFEERCMFFV
ncbi:hypothetical protein Peur_036014 [Populus x canadensis]